MAKRFKLRFSRVIPSFQFCRSKQSSSFPVSPLPSIYRVSPVNPKVFDIAYPNFPDPPPSTPNHPSGKRYVSSKIVSVGCGCRSRSCTQYLNSDCSTESPGHYKWKKEDQWHVVGRVDDDKPRRKICSASDTGDSDGDASPSPLQKTKKQVKKQKSKKKKTKASVRTSTSSGDSGWFSSEVNEDTEALLSSRSFSNDSSYDFDNQSENQNEKSSTNCKKKNNVKKVRRLKSYVSKNWRGSVTGKIKTKTKTITPSPPPPPPPTVETEQPEKESMFRRMMPCTVDGKVMESIAVEKKSEDPYEDFKRSMLEMILEKQMFEAKDLEELLHCFLTLNSRHHHGVIVEAFSEIWEVLFCNSPVNKRVSVGL